MTKIKSAAVIGAGVIGSGWIARLLLNGIDVDVFDPSDEAPQNVNKVIENAGRAYKKLLTLDLPKRGSFVFKNSVAEASKSADIIIEAVPERLSVKQAVYKEVENSAKNNAIIASSTSGILPTDLQAEMNSPDRFIVAHPFNPVYLLPLVELVGGSKTSNESIENAKHIFSEIGMFPLHVKKEIPAFIADRLLESVWREALWLVNDDIATTEEIDDAIRYGFGLRWAQMGAGAGLGLTLVQRFVDLHGGEVEVKSPQGKGTTITCRLPATGRGREAKPDLSVVNNTRRPNN